MQGTNDSKGLSLAEVRRESQAAVPASIFLTAANETLAACCSQLTPSLTSNLCCGLSCHIPRSEQQESIRPHACLMLGNGCGSAL